MRLIVVLVVLVAVALPSSSAADAGAHHADRSDVVEALEVLHGWDSRRELAWARADEHALRSLYLPGSAAARSDVRLLRSYTAQRFVVRHMVTQVFGVRVLRREPGRLVIRVLDRVAGGEVEQRVRDLALPSTRPVMRRIDFRRAAGSWQVAAISR